MYSNLCFIYFIVSHYNILVLTILPIVHYTYTAAIYIVPFLLGEGMGQGAVKPRSPEAPLFILFIFSFLERLSPSKSHCLIILHADICKLCLCDLFNILNLQNIQSKNIALWENAQFHLVFA